MHYLAKNYTGQTFNRLTGIAPTAQRRQHAIVWEWQCSCGAIAFVPANWVVSGNTKSCGCLQREAREAATRKHGLTNHPLHRVWRGMKKRCENKATRSYKNYGARGISVSPLWDEFNAFYQWATASGYEAGLTIERINNDGDYTPDNCKWASHHEQARNRSTTKLTLEQASQIRSDSRAQVAIAKEYGISSTMVRKIKSGKVWHDA